MTTPTWLIPGGVNKLLYDTGAGLVEATVGPGLSLSGGVLSVTGGGPSLSTLLPFGTVSEAMAASIPNTISAIRTAGFNFAGDQGEQTYARVNNLATPFVGRGEPGVDFTVVTPGMSSGVPVLVYSDTWYSITQQHSAGPTTMPIPAGSLVVAFIKQWNDPVITDFFDSAGNHYVSATSISPAGWPQGVFYCLSAIYAPIGTTFTSYTAALAVDIDVYCVPDFTGAALDQHIAVDLTSASTGGVTLTSPSLASSQEIVFGFVYAGFDAGTTGGTGATFQYTAPAGWLDISPQKAGRNPISAFIPNSSGPVTYNPTWSGAVGTAGTHIVTFKSYTRTAFNPSYWEAKPTWPLHTAGYGIAPGLNDNQIPFQRFMSWAASIAPPSDTSAGFTSADGATVVGAGTVTISVGSPAVVSFLTDHLLNDNGLNYPQIHDLFPGQSVSFNTTGLLPNGIVAGHRYYVQYASMVQNGTIDSGTGKWFATTFTLSTRSILGGQNLVAKGPDVVTTASPAQSGTHTITSYGHSWADIVLDPGVYFVGGNQFFQGYGLKKLRVHAHRARLQTNFHLAGSLPFDVNQTSGLSFSALFNAPDWTGGHPPSTITLVTAADAAHIIPNTWVALMCMELQGSTTGPPNSAIFEYIKVLSSNATTGVVRFYWPIRNNYRTTLPKINCNGTGRPLGAATIWQMPDTFDQEVELHGAIINSDKEEIFGGGLRSIRLVECEIFGDGLGTGPTPSTVQRLVFDRCRFHDYYPEIDKMIEQVEYRDCTFDNASAIWQPSASTVQMMILDGVRMYGIISFNGAPKSLVVRNSLLTGQFEFGPVLGVTERILFENSTIQYITSSRAENAYTRVDGSWTFVNGTIKAAPGVTPIGGIGVKWNPWRAATGAPPFSGLDAADNPFTWAVPGGKAAIFSDITSHGTPGIGTLRPDAFLGITKCFTVLDVNQDGSGNYCVDTDMAALPATNVTVTASVTGGPSSGVLHVTAVSPTDAFPMSFQLIQTTAGSLLPAGSYISVDLGVPNAANTAIGDYTIAASPSAAIPTLGSQTFKVSTGFAILAHPCPRLTVRNCSGGKFVSDQVDAPPDIPLLSYFKRAYQGIGIVQIGNGLDTVDIIGNLLSWTIKVTKPYTGTAGSFPLKISMGGWKDDPTAGRYFTYVQQVVELKAANPFVVTITPNAASQQDLVTGTVTTPAGLHAIPFWLLGGHHIQFGQATAENLSLMPRVVMQAQTDQGIDTGTAFINRVGALLTDGFVDVDILSDTTTRAFL